MVNKTALLASLPILTSLVGCSAGDVPVQQVKVQSGGTAANPVQGNPNIPQAAKDAMSGRGK